MIRGELTNLRAVERTDAGLLHRLFNEPAATSFSARQHSPVSSNEVQRRIESWLHAESTNGRPDCLIVESLDGIAIGAVVVVRVEERHRAIELDPLFEGVDEVAEDALQAAVDVCFSHWNLHRVWIRALAGDRSLRDMIEDCGFQTDAVLREAAFVDGRYEDVHLYCRLSTDESPADLESNRDE
jgi:RimJ/RimL family protein N-acetyltransferase